MKLFNAGRLTPRLSREEAIGNYMDVQVRAQLRQLYNGLRISTAPGQQVRVNNRAYSNSEGDRTYRVPDSRVGNVAFDVTLTRKTLRTPQIQGFFSA
ncbi:MAG: hypothetical protein ACREB3_05075, partial [Burkholderiales bacterium]